MTTVIVILLILWLVGAFGHRLSPRFPQTGSVIHTLLVIAVILLVLRLLGIV